MLKFVSNTMSGKTVKRILKSVIVVPMKSNSSKVIFEHYSRKLLKLKQLSQLRRTFHSDDKNKNHNNASHDKHSSCKKNWPSAESLSRHAHYKPLGVNDDWGPLSHKHELMPMDNMRYWHQHRCEVCDKLFEHKHKQRGDQSMNYNNHICSVCGGTKGSQRVSLKYDKSTNRSHRSNDPKRR